MVRWHCFSSLLSLSLSLSLVCSYFSFLCLCCLSRCLSVFHCGCPPVLFGNVSGCLVLSLGLSLSLSVPPSPSFCLPFSLLYCISQHKQASKHVYVHMCTHLNKHNYEYVFVDIYVCVYAYTQQTLMWHASCSSHGQSTKSQGHLRGYIGGRGVGGLNAEIRTQ